MKTRTSPFSILIPIGITMAAVAAIYGAAVIVSMMLHVPAPYSHESNELPNRLEAWSLNQAAEMSAESEGTPILKAPYKLDKDNDLDSLLQDEENEGMLLPETAKTASQLNQKWNDSHKLRIIGYLTIPDGPTKYPIVSSDQINQDAGSNKPEDVVAFLKSILPHA